MQGSGGSEDPAAVWLATAGPAGQRVAAELMGEVAERLRPSARIRRPSALALSSAQLVSTEQDRLQPD
jgi:hypothetical protein